MTDPMPRSEVKEAIAESETRTATAMKYAVSQLDVKLKWYVLASVGLNQVFNNVQIASVASASVLGFAVFVKGALWLRG